MRSFLSKLVFFFIGGYLFFNFLQFKGGSNVPQVNSIKNLSQTLNNNQPGVNNSTLQGNFIEKTLSRVFLNIMQNQEGAKLAQHFNIPFTQEEVNLSYINQEAVFYNKQTQEGEGQFASCNDTLIVDYKKFDKDRVLVKDEKNAIFYLNHDLTPNLQRMFLHKKTKEEFETQIYNIADNNLEIYQIFIKEIKFSHDQHQSRDLQTLNIVSGKGKKLLCGDNISIKFTLALSPTVPPITHTLHTRIGDDNIKPTEILNSFLGQRVGTKITFTTNKKVIDSFFINSKPIFNISSNSINNNNYLILTAELIN